MLMVSTHPQYVLSITSVILQLDLCDTNAWKVKTTSVHLRGQGPHKVYALIYFCSGFNFVIAKKRSKGLIS